MFRVFFLTLYKLGERIKDEIVQIVIVVWAVSHIFLFFQSHQELIEDISKDDPEPIDDVRLWEVNYKNRYYKTKFGLDDTNLRARYKIGKEYAKGLCWVLKYYYQVCVCILLQLVFYFILLILERECIVLVQIFWI